MADIEKIYKKEDLIESEDIILTGKQLNRILQRTPKKYIKKRPAKGGGEWSYTAVGYTTKILNIMFGWDWDFRILSEEILIEVGEVIVKGELTVRSSNKAIVKTQYGNKDIMFKRGTKQPLSIGNDIKAAASDALKKCASLIGIAADVYYADEFKEIKVDESPTRDIAKELCLCNDKDDVSMLWATLSDKEQEEYINLFNLINYEF